MNPMTEEEREFDREWSSAAGRRVAMHVAEREARDRAGTAFANRKDEVAKALRELADHLKGLADEYSAEVQSYIDATAKRPKHPEAQP